MRSFSISTRDFPAALPHHLTVGQEVTLTVKCRAVGIREEGADRLEMPWRDKDGVHPGGVSFVALGLDAEFVILSVEASE